MQAYSLIIANGAFSKTDDNLVQIISPTLAKAGDWECVIGNNSLLYTCKGPYSSNSQANLKYVIKSNGLSRLILKIPRSNPIIRKKKWLTKPGNFSLNGILTLSGGEISHRFAHFRTNN